MTAAAQDDASAPPAEEPPAKKKRGADRQMTKDDGDNEEETEAPSGAFVKANAETLAKRRIIKVKRPRASNEPSSSASAQVKKSNPFAMALGGAASTGSTVFGSSTGFGGTTTSTGFGGSSTGFGFGGTSSFSGFGTAAAGAKPSAFGFGSATTTTATTTSSSVFGGGGNKKEEPTTTFGFTSTAATSESAAMDKEVFPQDVAVVNGEEKDECVFEVRSKSFLLVDEDEKIDKKEGDEDGSIMSSVPPSSSNAPKKAEIGKETATDAAAATGGGATKTEGGDDEKTKEEPESKEEITAADKDEEASKEDDKATAQEGATISKKQQRWREMGTGPIRVLKTSGAARIVQRREASAGGMGYQLLVNAILAKESKLTRPSEKHVQLGTFADPPMSYLFKVRNAQDAEQLENALQKEIDSAKSVLKE